MGSNNGIFKYSISSIKTFNIYLLYIFSFSYQILWKQNQKRQPFICFVNSSFGFHVMFNYNIWNIWEYKIWHVNARKRIFQSLIFLLLLIYLKTPLNCTFYKSVVINGESPKTFIMTFVINHKRNTMATEGRKTTGRWNLVLHCSVRRYFDKENFSIWALLL